MKIKIYTVVYIKPEFIDIQIGGFRKYCMDDFELIIINNGLNKTIAEQINNKCIEYGLTCINVIKPTLPHEYCSSSHMDALEYALNTVIKNDVSDINVIIDNDVFAYKEFSFEKLLNGNKLAGMYQQRNEHDYISAIFIILDGKLDLSNFTFYSGYGDTGAAVQSLMTKCNIVPEYLNHTGQIDVETDYIFRNKSVSVPYEDKFRSQFIADAFIHYYRGSNWQETDVYYHQRKYKFLLNFLSHPEEYDLNLDENVNYPTAHSDKSYNGIDHNYNNYKYNKIKKLN